MLTINLYVSNIMPLQLKLFDICNWTYIYLLFG